MKFQKPIKVVIYTNNTNGALENCYCPDRPYGSVEKRSIYVSNFFKKHPNSILVDAGDIFTMAHRSYKDSLMAEAYKLLPYDAILYGDQELTMNSKTLDNRWWTCPTENGSADWLDQGYLSLVGNWKRCDSMN